MTSNKEHLSLNGDFSDVLSFESITFKDYKEIQPWITQRNVENRVKKSSVKQNLSTLRPSHLIVAIGELTEDDTDEKGNEYKKGTRFIIDSNTRKYFWQNGMTNKVPETLFAAVYREPSLIDLRKHYYSYDNPDATEQAAEVMTGIFSLFNFKPKSKKIQGGSITTAQNYASMWTPGAPLYGTNKGIWGIEPDNTETKTTAKRWAMAEQFKFWTREWSYLDNFELGGKLSVIDQPLLMALLVTSKSYMGEERFSDLIVKLNEKDYNPSSKTPVSKIGEAATAMTDDVYTKGSASYDQYVKAFDFYIYWIKRHMEDPDQTNCQGPKGGYSGKGKEWVESFTLTNKILESCLAA